MPIVPVATVRYASLENDLVLTAEFHPYQEVDVMAKVAGYVKAINVDIGDHVRQNEVLATLEVPEIQDDLAKAKAGEAAAEADVVTAQAARPACPGSGGNRHGLVRAHSGCSHHEIAVWCPNRMSMWHSRARPKRTLSWPVRSPLSKRHRTQKAEADSEYSRAAAMVQYATIRAPFTGVITKRYANTGSMIQAGISSQTQAMPIVSLAQNDLLRLILPVPVSDVGGVTRWRTRRRERREPWALAQGHGHALCRFRAVLHTHHGHRSRRAQSGWIADSGHVCRGAPASRRAPACAERAARRSGRNRHHGGAGLGGSRRHRAPDTGHHRSRKPPTASRFSPDCKAATR